MFAGIHAILVAVLAVQLQPRIALLRPYKRLSGYALSFGLTLFIVTWADFLCYALFGWGWSYLLATWALLVGTIAWLAHSDSRSLAEVKPASVGAGLLQTVGSWRQFDRWFLFVAAFVLVRNFSGLDVDENGDIWSNFNFEDSAYHLSVVNSLRAAPRFPPVDLNMPPFPLKYHFMADFLLAHFDRLGLPALTALQPVNFLSALVLVASLWVVFRRWLRLPSRWVALACVVFFYLSTPLLNLIHFLWLKPAYFDAHNLVTGVLLYPYFNFESAMVNMFNPQRGLVFTFPVLLLLIDAALDFAEEGVALEVALANSRARALESAVLVCLLPFAHAAGCVVLGCCLVPLLWKHRQWMAARYQYWAPALVLGILQLAYLLAYGPPQNGSFSGWDAGTRIPLGDFSVAPSWLRRPLFWLFVDGDFLVWGGLFAGLALLPRRWVGGWVSPDLREHVWRWRWYFAVCGFFFLLINYYRYSFDWGDSNKFVLFLNLGLTLVIAQGAARLIGPHLQSLSRSIWWFLFLLALVPRFYVFMSNAVVAPHGAVLLFHHNGQVVSEWLRRSTRPSEVVLTASYGTVHFVTALAGRPVVAGLYGDSNPYRQDERGEQIRRVYEEGDLALAEKLGVRYICISRFERRKYKLHRCWLDAMAQGRAVAVHSGEANDGYSVFVLDAQALRAGSRDDPVSGGRSPR